MKKLVVISVLITLIALSAAADGGGGVFWGFQIDNTKINEVLNLPQPDTEFQYFGGLGYGINRNNVISGGYGYAITDHRNPEILAGGIGGVIAGFRLIDTRIVNLMLMSYTGVGGMSVGGIFGDGYFMVSEEITLELGVEIFPWFMPTAFVGLQGAASITPGKPFEDFAYITPVAGIRVSWGSF